MIVIGVDVHKQSVTGLLPGRALTVLGVRTPWGAQSQWRAESVRFAGRSKKRTPRVHKYDLAASRTDSPP